MSKSTFFTGQPIFSQLLKFVPRSTVAGVARQFNADRYCKRFSTYDHLVSMLYGIFNHCTSLREITTGMLAWEHRLSHLGIYHHPRRSTIADANCRRSSEVFEHIYLKLYERFGHFLSDSRAESKQARLYIFDSTTITLFQEVLKAAGTTPLNGKRKGGIKVHTLIRSDQDIPCLVRFSAGAANDMRFLKEIHLPGGSVVVFDKGYNDYTAFNRFTKERVSWVTRLHRHLVYKKLVDRDVKELQQEKGVIYDQEIILGVDYKPKKPKVRARLISFIDPESGKTLEFLTNNFKMAPATIAAIYKKRWQIELLFKRIKQNYPLKYFLGDSENAIKIQIWCALIADLLLKIIRKGAKARLSFSNLSALVRLHLMTYIDLFNFLKHPEKALLKKIIDEPNTPLLFSP
jgi:Domain of unknown function (DUF4372)/Transposase DDE domain